MKYIAPKSGLASFTCPHCGVLARQYHNLCINGQWSDFSPATIEFAKGIPDRDFVIVISKCEHCKKICIWHFDKMAYPNRGSVPSPNPDMPADVKEDYEEAAGIYIQSSRGAAALLRLAIQKLCKHLGGTGENINKDIAAFVSSGLPKKIQQALDLVRVIGNNAVHPGQINTDDPETTEKLFVLLNLIAEHMITMPKQVDEMYADIPEKTRKAIERRDKP